MDCGLQAATTRRPPLIGIHVGINRRIALITGGGTGIGAACARQFAAAGARVALVGRRRAALEAIASECGAFPIVADASEADQMGAAINLISERWGDLDVLIANAGGHHPGAALDTTEDDWTRARRENLDTAFVAARTALPSLLRSRGAIVFVSSIAGLVAGPEVCGYTTFKHAVIGLTRSLARDYGPLGLRVNAVCPGWVRTPMADEEMQPLMRRHGLTLDGAYALVTKDVPLRRAAQPEEIASICRFLACEESSIITGAVIVADGGSTVVDVPTLEFAR